MGIKVISIRESILKWIIILENVLLITAMITYNNNLKLLFNLIMVLICMLFLLCVFEIKIKKELLFIWLIFSIMGFSFINVLQYHQQLKGVIYFSISLLFIISIYIIKISSKNFNILLNMNIISSVFNIYFSFSSSSYVFGDMLTLRLPNPNLTGIYIANVIIFLILGALYFKNVKRYFCIVLALSNFILLMKTQNRGSAIAVILTLIIYICYLKKDSIPRVLSLALLLSPIIIAFFYVGIYQKFGNFTFGSKSFFTGREMDWFNMFQIIKNESISALSSYYQSGQNAYLSILVRFGFIAFVLFIILIIKLSVMKNMKLNNNVVKFASIAYLCLFLQQSFEETLVLGTNAYFIFNYILLVIPYSPQLNEFLLEKDNKRK